MGGKVCCGQNLPKGRFMPISSQLVTLNLTALAEFANSLDEAIEDSLCARTMTRHIRREASRLKFHDSPLIVFPIQASFNGAECQCGNNMGHIRILTNRIDFQRSINRGGGRNEGSEMLAKKHFDFLIELRFTIVCDLYYSLDANDRQVCYFFIPNHMLRKEVKERRLTYKGWSRQEFYRFIIHQNNSKEWRKMNDVNKFFKEVTMGV